MDKNKRSMKDKVKQLFEDYRLQQKTLTEVKAEILRLLDVVGQSEQYFCCKDQIKQRCDEQCLGCYMHANDKV